MQRGFCPGGLLILLCACENLRTLIGAFIKALIKVQKAGHCASATIAGTGIIRYCLGAVRPGPV